jgi:hypothetical protein
MALSPSTSFTQNVDDIYSGVVADTTSNYGGSNPLRGDAANYLLWSKTDQNGNRVFNNPDFGAVLAIMQWTVTISVSGWYERMLMRIQPYNNGSSYVPEISSGGIITQYASVVYYAATNKVYKCILSSTGHLPTDATYWVEVPDLSTLIGNTNITTTITNTYVRSTVDESMKRLFASLGKYRACDDKEVERADRLDALLIAADSEVTQGNYDDMDKIIQDLNSQLTPLL